MALQKIGGLEIDKGAASPQTIFWRTQKIAFVISIALIIAAILGLFGPGLLSKVHITTPLLEVDYHFFSRVQTTNEITLTYHPDITINKASTYFILRAKRKFFDGSLIQNITPQPFYQKTDGSFILFYFPYQPSSEALRVHFVMEPLAPGMQIGEFAVQDQKIMIKQFIYP